MFHHVSIYKKNARAIKKGTGHNKNIFPFLCQGQREMREKTYNRKVAGHSSARKFFAVLLVKRTSPFFQKGTRNRPM
jgi:hypothetical protein